MTGDETATGAFVHPGDVVGSSRVAGQGSGLHDKGRRSDVLESRGGAGDCRRRYPRKVP